MPPRKLEPSFTVEVPGLTEKEYAAMGTQRQKSSARRATVQSKRGAKTARSTVAKVKDKMVSVQGLSEPAENASLAGLRDTSFQRHGRRLEPTQLAEKATRPVGRVMTTNDRVRRRGEGSTESSEHA